MVELILRESRCARNAGRANAKLAWAGNSEAFRPLLSKLYMHFTSVCLQQSNEFTR